MKRLPDADEGQDVHLDDCLRNDASSDNRHSLKRKSEEIISKGQKRVKICSQAPNTEAISVSDLEF